MSRFLRIVLLLSFAWKSDLAQNPQAQTSATISLPAIPLLPQTLGAWQRSDSAAGTDVTLADPAAAPVLNEDGLQRFATATYTLPGSPKPLNVRAFQFGDATGAYSAFTFYRRPGMRMVPGARVGADSVSGTDSGSEETLFWEGTTVVLVHGRAPAHDLQVLAAGLPKVGGRRGQAPLLPTLLPSTGLDARTLRYALGPAAYSANGGPVPASLIQFGKATEVVTAEYTTRTGRGLLTLLLAPTPRIAGDQARAIEALFSKGLPAGSTPESTKLRRIGPLVALTTGAFSADEAGRLLAAVQLPMEATWNKPVPLEFHTEVRKTASLLYNIAVFSGVLGLAAIFLGLFLGYGRAAIRVLQGKPAYTEPEFLRIDLRGSGDQPIRPLK